MHHPARGRLDGKSYRALALAPWLLPPMSAAQREVLAVSFDHLVGALLKMQRHFESERFGGPEVEHQLELRRLYDRQVARFGALENSASVDTCLAIRIRQAGPVADQAASNNVFAPDIGRRYAILPGKR